ncbi:MAG: tetratricopeptide repeat protein, partial [Fuerstiella sp.]
MSLPSESESRKRTRFRPIHIVGISLLLGGVIWFQRESSVLNQMVVNAESAASAGDFRTAQQLAMKVLLSEPENPRARLVAAKCLHVQDRSLEAIELLSDTSFVQPSHAVEAACLAGDIRFLKLYQPSEAEALYQQALRHDPSSIDANDRLAILLGVSGQWWRQIPVRLTTVHGG